MLNLITTSTKSNGIISDIRIHSLAVSIGIYAIQATMKPDKIPLLIVLLVIVVLPFAVWSMFGLIARVGKTNLRPTVPWLRAARWSAWLVGASLLLAGLLSQRFFWLFWVGTAMSSCSAGLTLLERWVKRHYAPELEPPYDRWLAMRMR